MKRFVIFLFTNMSLLIVLSISMNLLGLQRIFNEKYALDPGELLIFLTVICFTGTFISLVTSKWSARVVSGAKVGLAST